jgi:thiamine-monophosphate kinase
MPSEFDLIEKFFTRPPRANSAVSLGVGDDCALLAPAPGTQLAVSSDMLVAGRHFFPDVDPFYLGHKSLAVNLSDLAAMGARPLAFTLALSLPEVSESWLSAFSQGLLQLADRFDCQLVGGDTTKGPLNICITIFGEVGTADALRRDGALAEDDIWVSGTLGDARLALAALLKDMELESGDLNTALERLHAPQPRVALGLELRGIATSAIDISDGLVGDLGHILKRSHVGARLDVDALPIGHSLARQPCDLQRRFALAGGDDYELCFTAPAAMRDKVHAASQAANVDVTRVGTIETEPGLRLVDANGMPVALTLSAFDHFAS